MSESTYFNDFQLGEEIIEATQEPFRRILNECFDDFLVGEWWIPWSDDNNHAMQFEWVLNGDGVLRNQPPIRMTFDPDDFHTSLGDYLDRCTNSDGLMAAEDIEKVRSTIDKFRSIIDSIEQEIADRSP